MAGSRRRHADVLAAAPAAARPKTARRSARLTKSRWRGEEAGEQDEAPSRADVEPTVRKNFADTAFWAATR